MVPPTSKAHIGRRVHFGFGNPFMAFLLALAICLNSEDLQFLAPPYTVVLTDGLEESSQSELVQNHRLSIPLVLQTRSLKPIGAQWLSQVHLASKWQSSSALSPSPVFFAPYHPACIFFNGKQIAYYPRSSWDMGINMRRTIPPKLLAPNKDELSMGTPGPIFYRFLKSYLML